MAAVFRLQRGETLLGVLNVYGGDMPWLHCKFEPTEAFLAIKPLFDRDMELADAKEYVEELVVLYQQIENLGLHLVLLPDGEEIRDFMLHIKGNEAWFTY